MIRAVLLGLLIVIGLGARDAMAARGDNHGWAPKYCARSSE